MLVEFVAADWCKSECVTKPDNQFREVGASASDFVGDGSLRSGVNTETVRERKNLGGHITSVGQEFLDDCADCFGSAA